MHDTTHRSESAIQHDPSPAEAVAALFDDLEAFWRGERPLGDVLGLRVQDLAALTTTADRLLSAGRPREAADLYEGALYLFPTEPMTLCRLGTARALHGDVDGARACFALALDHTGHDPTLRGYIDGLLPAA